MTGTAVVSLDFELAWGHRRTNPDYVDRLRIDVDRTIDRIRRLNDCFQAHDVPATWAVVGELTQDGDDPLLHNPDLFEDVLTAEVGHEIGLHSHSHPDYDSLTAAEARADVAAGVEALAVWDVTPETFIYPRERVDHLDILPEFGFRFHRTDVCSTKIQRGLRLVYPPVLDSPRPDSSLTNVQGTLFLGEDRPLHLLHLNVKRSLSRAARKGGIVHLWIHPHDVSVSEERLKLVQQVIELLAAYRDQGKIEIRTLSGFDINGH